MYSNTEEPSTSKKDTETLPYYQGLVLIDEDQAVKELKAMSIQYIFQKVTNSEQPNSY